ncbi:MAG: PQQ-dependent sugar dehydrogenase [Gammaproteobacteria bacterium]|nr:PQQ-dependent sugar dehydrogenase [Gammaproteobacteria bacterium]
MLLAGLAALIVVAVPLSDAAEDDRSLLQIVTTGLFGLLDDEKPSLPPPQTLDSDLYRVEAETIANGLENPWAVAFLPDGGYLVTERPGRLRLISAAGELLPQAVGGLPPIAQAGQGGLLDVVLHPDFATNRWVYFSFAEAGSGGVGTAVARGRLNGMQLDDTEVLFRMSNKTSSGRHFGSRLVFDNAGYLFITLGDRGDRPRAQALDDHAGSVIRLHDDGSIPTDNPFSGQAGVLPGIYSYGHRNLQGAALHPVTGELWTHEHGPQGGDEVNIPRPGLNYGWPVITYGVEYGIGTSIGEGTAKAGMEQPLHYWVPSIAPSGMAFYTGAAFPAWQGNLFVGGLKFRQLVRLELEGEQVTHEERLFTGELGRIRDVRQGPDGLLYLLTDAGNGELIRLRPAL